MRNRKSLTPSPIPTLPLGEKHGKLWIDMQVYDDGYLVLTAWTKDGYKTQRSHTNPTALFAALLTLALGSMIGGERRK